MKKDSATKLDNDAVHKLLSPSWKELGLGKDVSDALHPTTPGTFLFWVDTDQTKNANYKDGEDVIVSTQGDSIFLQKITRASNDVFDGMEHGKLLSQISTRTNHHADGDKPLPGDDKEGVAEDEWD